MGAKSITLNNGVQMPEIGYGVFRVEEGKDLEKAVETAIRIGYRSIDTAAIYQNEKSVGKGVQNAIDAGLVTREELFITSKVWNDGLSYDETIQAYNDTLERLGLEYLDLYLIHWPGQNKYMEPWKALEALYKEGRIKSIGVSNFQVSHLEHLLETAEVKPVINQIEFHPKLVQEDVRAFCEKHDIQVEAWSPLMNAELLNHETVNEIAESLGKSAAQVILRWDLQHGVVTIPKSMTESRIKENIEIYDFELTEEQVKTLDALDEHKRIGPDPDQFDFK
ncbi:aldo/keto reductase [Rossellomorea marisflavi]|uniref:aldo/keto reductase n=1 Tax=Rossellomorea marisflavi TaxID=189381 RepID=UPI001EE17D8E|nr:aldo/keto reductase [Rossellomorea marisflavi]UKS66361.1 aldo/keto reductase [Rossellomorea marisflavi]WJV17906.1 aldo/keto reductase [Rossellomorea marisflavi]